MKTRGWVFPEGFAVCWNGMVYRTLSVGEPGDLDDDVKKIIASDPRKNGDFTRFTRNEETPPAVAFWFDLELRGSMVPASIALLLRLNRPDLATALWQAYQVPDVRGGVRGTAQSTPEWFRAASVEWLITAFHRLTGHFSNADDLDAVEVGESLIAWGDHVRAALRKDRPDRVANLTVLDFLHPAPVFLSDARRRLGAPLRSPWPNTVIEKRAVPAHDPAARPNSPSRHSIVELIDRLESIKTEKIMWPGILIFSVEPICLELSQWGDAAVEPLLDVLENDRRLTRTLEFDRPWSIEQKPVWVKDVAKELLGNLLDSPALIASSTPGELRLWWAGNRTTARLGRQFELLAAENSPPETWISSAEYLTRRSDIIVSTTGVSRRAMGGCNPDQPVPPMLGEDLRAGHGAEVTGLLHRRTLTLAAAHRSDEACRMAFLAYLWEPASALPSLQAAAGDKSCRDYHLVTAARLALRDLPAASEWSEMVREPASSPFAGGEALLPLWLYPDNPVLAQAAEWLASRLQPSTLSLFASNASVLAVPAFRRAAIRLLSDATAFGVVTRSLDGSLGYSWTTGAVEGGAGGGGWLEVGLEETLGQLPPGKSHPLRINDFLATQISSVAGTPGFRLDWSEADRNRAIAAIARYLDSNGNRFRARPTRLEDVACSGPGVYLEP
ncbi:hypothetical protein [Paludibaculum fermentans]|uniref:hypothetical protein n=1 Tax=Paludibaculum fermentans TaxID=1473598 RepID=UPI003EBEE857